MRIADNLKRVNENVAAAAARAGRDPTDITLVMGARRLSGRAGGRSETIDVPVRDSRLMAARCSRR